MQRWANLLWWSAWVALLGALTLRVHPQWHFAEPAPPRAAETAVTEPVLVVAQSHFLKAPAASSHASNLALSDDGRLLCIWYAGRREGSRDVRLWLAEFNGLAWGPAEPILDARGASLGLHRYVAKLGNPVLAFDPAGTAHLFFVSVSAFGWAASQINYSRGGGAAHGWSAPARLVASPLFNLSTLVRGAPAALRWSAAGEEPAAGWLLPAYHELHAKFPEFLALDGDGRVRDRVRVVEARGLLQPVLVYQGGYLRAYLRDSTPLRRVRELASEDGGHRWTLQPPLALHSPDAAVAALPLGSEVLIATQASASERSVLALYALRDRQAPRELLRVEAGEPGSEYSYPSLVAGRAGIDLSYTWRRGAIRHLRLERNR